MSVHSACFVLRSVGNLCEGLCQCTLHALQSNLLVVCVKVCVSAS